MLIAATQTCKIQADKAQIHFPQYLNEIPRHLRMVGKIFTRSVRILRQIASVENDEITFADVVTFENLFGDLGFPDVTYIDDYASADGELSWRSSLPLVYVKIGANVPLGHKAILVLVGFANNRIMHVNCQR